MPFTGSLPRRLDRVFFHQSRTNLVPISYQSRTNIKKCLCPENKGLHVQKIKAFVFCLHKMEFVIYKEKYKTVFSPKLEIWLIITSQISFLVNTQFFIFSL